jgi:hypothetical protein
MKFFFCGGSNIDLRIKIHNLIPEQKYPHIVSQHFNATHINEGTSSGSNKRSIRKIFYEYDMNEFDFICIEFTPYPRTEFYDDQEKKWIKFAYSYHPNKTSDKNKKLMTTYYSEIYNADHGNLQYEIEFTTIKKYLTAIKKPFALINTDLQYRGFQKHDFNVAEYDTNNLHLTDIGHKMIAKNIIKHYENFLQR